MQAQLKRRYQGGCLPAAASARHIWLCISGSRRFAGSRGSEAGLWWPDDFPGLVFRTGDCMQSKLPRIYALADLTSAGVVLALALVPTARLAQTLKEHMRALKSMALHQIHNSFFCAGGASLFHTMPPYCYLHTHSSSNPAVTHRRYVTAQPQLRTRTP